MKPKLPAYLSDHVAESFTLAASRPGADKSAIVSAALDRFLNAERDQSGDAAQVRRLDRMSRKFGQIERDLSITAEILALFVRYYLTMTPELPLGDQDATQALGRKRFEMFIVQIGKRFAAGGRLVPDLMERVNHSNPDLFLRNLEEGAPLGEASAVTEARFRAREATDKPPGHFPEGREEAGDV